MSDEVISHFRLARVLSRLLDSQFKIGKFSAGLDPILGLIPIWGDLFSFGLSLYIIWIAKEMKLPAEKISQMIGNSFLDFFIGLIPFLGDIADFFYKSNLRNIKIMEDYLKDMDFTEAKII